MTKSVLSMLVGIAIADGHLTGLDQALVELLSAYAHTCTPTSRRQRCNNC